MESKKVLKSQGGFTLIELVAVIVVLGILAVVAVPRFINLQEEANQAAVEGVAGGLASAFALNYAACAVENAECVEVNDCDDGDSLLIGGLDGDYSITAGALDGFGTTATCTVTGPEGHTAEFPGIGTTGL